MRSYRMLPLPLQDQATCLHFGVCGGCTCAPGIDGATPRPVPYQDELVAKESRVRGLLAGYEIEEWRPIVASPEEWYYRNKMEYAFAWGDENTPLILGQRQAGRYDRIVDLETCFLMSPQSLEILKRVRTWARENELAGYHRKRHVGDLRYLVLREGKNTGHSMAILIASLSSQEAIQKALPDLQKEIQPLLTTCWLAFADTKSDVARTADMRLLWGTGTIDERLGDITYRVSPYSFFQTNTRGTERLYALLADWGQSIAAGALVDAYCGSGGIALALAKSFDRVVGVDSNKEAIEDAIFNAARNGLSNTEFVAEDALDFLKKLPASKLSIQLSAAIVDPPRPGLHPKALQALIELNPPHLAYVSCNPESLARDLQSLAPLYRIRHAQPVDLFPHTPHVETVVAMEHR